MRNAHSPQAEGAVKKIESLDSTYQTSAVGKGASGRYTRADKSSTSAPPLTLKLESLGENKGTILFIDLHRAATAGARSLEV